MVRRQDRGELRAAYMRSDGTLLCEGIAARAGIYTYYDAANNPRRELVTEETLRASADELARSTVVLEHPDRQRYPDGVTPQLHKELSVGDTDGDVVVSQGGYVRVHLAVRDSTAISAVQRGKVELSPGYDATLSGVGGVHEVFGRYDDEQTSRRYDHLAIVDRARGGPDCRIRVDEDERVLSEPFALTPNASASRGSTRNRDSRGGRMLARLLAALSLVGVTERYDSEEAAAERLLSALKQKRDEEAVAELTEEEKAAAKQAEYDALKGLYDAAIAELGTLRAAKDAETDKAAIAKADGLCRSLKVDPTKFTKAKDLHRALYTADCARRGAQPRSDASDDLVAGHVEALLLQRVDDRARGAKVWEQPPPRDDRSGAARADGPPVRRRGPSALSAAQRDDALKPGGRT